MDEISHISREKVTSDPEVVCSAQQRIHVRVSRSTFGRISHIFCVKVDLEFDVGYSSDAMLGTAVDTRSRQSGRLFLRLPRIFHVKEDSRILKSLCPALLSKGEVSTADASVAVFTWKSATPIDAHSWGAIDTDTVVTLCQNHNHHHTNTKRLRQVA